MRRARWLVLPLAGLLLAGCSDAGSSTTPVIEARVNADGVTLGLVLESCGTTEKVAEVTESDTEVRITVTTKGGSEESCVDTMEVELSDPLGDRPLIDDPTDTEIVVGGRARAAG